MVYTIEPALIHARRNLTTLKKILATTLNLVPSLPARRLPDGRVVLTQKFLDGVNQFQRFWTDPIAVYMRESPGATGNLDEVFVSPKISLFDSKF